MPEFAPNENKVATLPVIFDPPGINCEAELFLGPNETDRVAISERRQFTSTGEKQDVELTIVLPSSPGSYTAYVDIEVGGKLWGFYDPEVIVISEEEQVGEDIVPGAEITIGAYNTGDVLVDSLTKAQAYRLRIMTHNKTRNLALDPSYDWWAATMSTRVRVMLNSTTLFDEQVSSNFGPGESLPYEYSITPQTPGQLSVEVWVKDESGTELATAARTWVIADIPISIGGAPGQSGGTLRLDYYSANGLAGISMKFEAWVGSTQYSLLKGTDPDSPKYWYVAGPGTSTFERILGVVPLEDNTSLCSIGNVSGKNIVIYIRAPGSSQWVYFTTITGW